MTGTTDLKSIIQSIVDRHGAFSPEAYLFVLEALETVMAKKRKRGHITGQRLLDGIKDLARQRYGLMARDVLAEWGVRSTLDFGRIVFQLVDAQLLTKTSDDSLSDFIDRYDFRKVFEEEYFKGRA